jgi:cytochrome c oxidase assembly protein subunit 15
MLKPEFKSPARIRAVRLWLIIAAALVFAMVLVGGATRLTESGLSIVEWKPVTGAVPPLSEADWQAEFQKYQAIPQYTQLNHGMSLDEFKTIYWWEWAHRLLGRVVGAAFLIPFLVFLWRGWIEPSWQWRLWGIFGLGAFQGAIGWWMVASGLSERVSVSQYRLAFHLTLACLIYAVLLWFAFSVAGREGRSVARDFRKSALGLLGLILLQIYLGALVAGMDAGLTFNTWPLIDGHFIPAFERLFFERPLWRNLFENALTVQFNHRMIAYVLWVAAVLHAIRARQPDAREGWQGAFALALALTLQAALGIVTLLHQAPLPLALAHQMMAMIVLTIAVWHAHALRAQPGRVAAVVRG